MVTTLVLFQLFIVLVLIFIGARVGSIGLGIYGMVGVFILVFIFGLQPGKLPIDVMLIIVSVITAAAALQAAGGLDYLVGLAAKFLRKHPGHITFYGPLTTWLFCLVSGTAHTSYSLLPIISEIATNSKIRPERPMSVATIAASLGITGSPVSAATAAIISTDLLGGRGIELKDILIICIPASLIAILVASFVQNFIGKELEEDPEYIRRVKEGIINPKEDARLMEQMEQHPDKHAKYSVIAFLLGVFLVVLFGSVPSLRPSFMVDGSRHSTGGQSRCQKSRARQRIRGRHECYGQHFRYSLDGRHLLQRQSGFLQKPHRRHRFAISFPLLRGPFHHVYYAVFTGCHCSHALSAWYWTRHNTAGPHSHVSGSQWIFLLS